ncbi:hypothetical protein BH11BAC1_BH11BAC1_23940 [soil metagenome]
MDTSYQFTIRLRGSEPEIWRRIQVVTDTTLFELHHVIQIAMGWTNSHLYEFQLKELHFGTQYSDDQEVYGDDFRDASLISIKELELKPEQIFVYQYDFGDNWEHSIHVDKIELKDDNKKYPFCIDGQQKCPPEDCGGIRRYYEMLEILASKNHPEKKELKEWLGARFDPNHFDKDKVNRQLKKIDKYIAEWIDGNK